MTNNNNGQRMDTPALSSAIKADLIIQNMDKELKKNWKATPEITPCGVCKGTGKDKDEHSGICGACDGSGRDFELHYGCEDGKWYAYVVQYGLERLKEYCKLRREAESERVRSGAAMLATCAFPKFLQMELSAQGWTPEAIADPSAPREISNYVVKHYPWLMYTNLKSF